MARYGSAKIGSVSNSLNRRKKCQFIGLPYKFFLLKNLFKVFWAGLLASLFLVALVQCSLGGVNNALQRMCLVTNFPRSSFKKSRSTYLPGKPSGHGSNTSASSEWNQCSNDSNVGSRTKRRLVWLF